MYLGGFMKKAFTLAEVLITLGVIGVVSILTVPNIVSNYQKKVFDAKVKKVENSLANAFGLLLADEEVVSLYDSSLYIDAINEDTVTNSVGSFLKKYLKVSKDCGYAPGISDCHEETFIDVQDNAVVDSFPGMYAYCVKIDMGALICVSSLTSGKIPQVSVDFNGDKAPNVVEKDIVFFSVAKDGSLNRTNYNGGKFYTYFNDIGDNPEGVAQVLSTILGVSYEEALDLVDSSKLGPFGKGDCFAVKTAVEAEGAVVDCGPSKPNIIPPPRK